MLRWRSPALAAAPAALAAAGPAYPAGRRRIVEQRRHLGRHQEGGGHAVPRHRIGEQVRRPLFQQDDGEAAPYADLEPHEQAGDMEQWRGAAHDVVVGQLEGLRAEAGGERPVAVRDQHALGLAGRAAGKGDRRRIVRRDRDRRIGLRRVADEGIERVRPCGAADRHDPLQRRGRRQQRARFGGIGGMDEQQFGADPGQHFGPAGGIGADRDMGERAAGPRRAEMDGRIIDIVGRQDRQPAARCGRI